MRLPCTSIKMHLLPVLYKYDQMTDAPDRATLPSLNHFPLQNMQNMQFCKYWNSNPDSTGRIVPTLI
jgi:hypothetical protein